MSDSLYKIFETENFIKRLDKLDQHIRKNIQSRLTKTVYPQLRKEPHYGLNIKKLRSYSSDTWRYRIGDYRLFYEIEEDIRVLDIIAIETRQIA